MTNRAVHALGRHSVPRAVGKRFGLRALRSGCEDATAPQRSLGSVAESLPALCLASLTGEGPGAIASCVIRVSSLAGGHLQVTSP